MFPRWSDRIADAKRGSLWRPIRKLYKKAKAAREAALSARESRQKAQTQPQAIWGPSAPTGAQLSGLEPAVDYMAIDPALTADSNRIRPRLITDMIFSESSAHTLSSESPMPYTKIPTTSNPVPDPASIRRNQRHEEFLRSRNLKRSTEVDMPPPPFDFDSIVSDSGASVAQAFLAWPDMNFDIPVAFPTSSYDTVQPQAPASAIAGTVAGNASILTDPAVLDTSMMNWTTWDEFVLDTYANLTPKSRSQGSEGS